MKKTIALIIKLTITLTLLSIFKRFAAPIWASSPIA